MRYIRGNKLVIRLSGLSVKLVNRQTKKGFTLIELLIVSAMIPVISFAIYASFNNSIKIWQRINKEIPGEDLNIFFDKFALDLRNSFRFSGIKFLGKENEVEFAAIVSSQRLEKIAVGKVIYSYDTKNSTVTREQKDFSHIYNNESGLIRQVLNDIKSLKFHYYFYNVQDKEYFWLEEWFNEALPLAVRVELEIKQGGRINKFIRTVSIPASG